jgi:exportin-T
VPWQRVELALALLYGFGETLLPLRRTAMMLISIECTPGQAIAGQGPSSFVLVPQEELTRGKREANYSVNFNQFPLSPLGELMLRACRSKVAAHDHAAVNLMFFETVVRYSEFFKLCPEYIAGILPTFLDQQ